jgi:probable HAF family extracellular repeat protein
VVVGGATNAAGQERAFRWTASGGMQDLGTLGGNWSEAYGVSADGSVVVGWAETPQGRRAFRWTASGGMEDLNTTYASLLTNGSVLWVARAISPDGRYIVGWGYNAATGARSLPAGYGLHRSQRRCGPQRLCGRRRPAGSAVRVWRAGSNRNEDVNCDGTVDDADLLQVLFNFGSGC